MPFLYAPLRRSSGPNERHAGKVRVGHLLENLFCFSSRIASRVFFADIFKNKSFGARFWLTVAWRLPCRLPR